MLFDNLLAHKLVFRSGEVKKIMCLLVTEIGLIILLDSGSFCLVFRNVDMEDMLMAVPHLATLKYHF
jgi:hypothetical protein